MPHLVIASLVAPLRERCLRLKTDNRIEIDCPAVAVAPRYLVRELFVTLWSEQQWPTQDMTFEKWNEIADLAAARVPALSLPGDIRAERIGDRMILLGATSPISKFGSWGMREYGGQPEAEALKLKAVKALIGTLRE